MAVELKYVVAPMEHSHLRAVMALERAVFTDDWPIEAFKEHLEEPSAGGLVVLTNDLLIGYACYQMEKEHLHLTNLAVAPEYRRKSVAKGVLDHILGLARQQACELIYLEVRLSNEAARNFYRNAGFVEIDIVADYYESPAEDAVVMLARVDTEG